MIKNPDGSIPVNEIVNRNGMMKKVLSLVNEQSACIANQDISKLAEIRKNLLNVYKKIIIGTSVESNVIEETNKKYSNMSKAKNRRKGIENINIGGKFSQRDEEEIYKEKNEINITMYNSLKSSGFGKADNIVRCELNREEDYEEVEIQKLALWSNKLAHFIENDSTRYMTDLGYGNTNWNRKNLTEDEIEKQKSQEKRFLTNLRKAYKHYTEENKYKFALSKAYGLLSQDDFDVNTTTDQNIVNLKKLMNDSRFSRSSNDKNAMKSFLYCLRDQRNKDYFFKLKENFSKELLLNLKELDGESVLGAYYTEDYAVKDNKGRDTIRVVFFNQGEANRLTEENDYMYMTRAWKESLKHEYADKILSEVGENQPSFKYDNKLNDIISKKLKGKKMTKTEIDSTCLLLSASIYHLPKNEILEFCNKNGVELRESKNLTEQSVAYNGNESIDVGFGSQRNDIPYEKLPRYKAINSEVLPIEMRCDELQQKKMKSQNKGKGE